MQELPKTYEPSRTEERVARRWLEAKAFAAAPDGRDRRYVVMMPLPNVTGALHMGHAMDNVMQDLLVRWHRMSGDNTLWMPGTDHAGIATQAVVEKRLIELEGKTRHDIGRDALVKRIWDWKEQCQSRIIRQQQSMGCSCDWDRYRFTMDAVCARAVRHTFFRLFRDGLIHRGTRLVNWDCALQTAVSDDEIEHETVLGHFWHLRYPVIDPAPGEPDHVIVATTRPETMLGDTAVACHPDPEGALRRSIDKARKGLAEASAKDKPALETELMALEERLTTHLPTLRTLVGMARAGRKIRLPLVDREIPLILDEWAKPELGSGCVKITPAHDPNDYDVWGRHRDAIQVINILNPDGTLNAEAGPYRGIDRFEARDRVVADLEQLGLLEAVEDRQVEIGHSDRSKTPVEPYLSLQWFVRMGDVPGGVVMGRGTANEFKAPGLAQAAIAAADGSWRSRSGRAVAFHPDGGRYRDTCLDWLSEKRDWCISRQLWWGHRIPVWSKALDNDALAKERPLLERWSGRDDVCISLRDQGGRALKLEHAGPESPGTFDVQICLRDQQTDRLVAAELDAAGFIRDADVLDTWFSSAVWPHSTLGWPDPATAEIEPGQTALGAVDGLADCLSYYYPGSCLVTGRDIITLWVARMVITGLYNLGDVPFTDVFIHANIQDGKGERMSKSKGNGIDPVDIIEQYGADAMRYVVCEMQTGTQDIRLPVQAVSPFTGELVDLATARHGGSIFTYLCPATGREFDVLGTMPGVPPAKLVSDRFDVGRNFCNKLWNAFRFALMNLEGAAFAPLDPAALPDEDRWVLSRLEDCTATVQSQLQAYNPSAAIGAVREFFWGELCDWYLELIKPRLRAGGPGATAARQVLAHVMDQVLRLMHPFVPFITEELWAHLAAAAPRRGIDRELPVTPLLIAAPWPPPRPEWRDADMEERFSLVAEVVRAVRDIRNKHAVTPARKLAAAVRAEGAAAEAIGRARGHIMQMAGLETLEVAPDAGRPPGAAAAVVAAAEVFVAGLVDAGKERQRLGKEIASLERSVAGIAAKLDDDGFTAKAPPRVVAKERDRLAEYRDKLAKLERQLAALG